MHDASIEILVIPWLRKHNAHDLEIHFHTSLSFPLECGDIHTDDFPNHIIGELHQDHGVGSSTQELEVIDGFHAKDATDGSKTISESIISLCGAIVFIQILIPVEGTV